MSAIVQRDDRGCEGAIDGILCEHYGRIRCPPVSLNRSSRSDAVSRVFRDWCSGEVEARPVTIARAVFASGLRVSQSVRHSRV